MDVPTWLLELIRKFNAPPTGRVIINLERYQGGITKVEIGGTVREKPPPQEDKRK
jgi:hypothetical protein